ncbi:PEP-CTERM sorting domain-containing protein [uncultured Aquincola sp.]|uniref:PEP-CTERM sorting domain-containing protein n=1 Tax=uncultured Aquincola sp. TaxID=886556 RepID=UPI0032B11427
MRLLPTHALTLLAALCGAGAAHAQSYNVFGTVTAEASSRIAPVPAYQMNPASVLRQDDPLALQPNPLAVSASAGPGVANAKFIGSVGVLKAYASTSFPYAYNAANEVVNDGYASAQVDGSFVDHILVTGAGLSLLTPVTYSVVFTIAGTTSSQGGYATAGARLSDVDRGTYAAPLNWDSRSNAPGSFTVSINTFVGDTLRLSGQLTAWAYSTSNSPTLSSGEADFYNSAHFHLTPSIAGLNTTGASGYNYLATAVPEPATAWLLALGVAGLIGHRRRYSTSLSR